MQSEAIYVEGARGGLSGTSPPCRMLCQMKERRNKGFQGINARLGYSPEESIRMKEGKSGAGVGLLT